MAKINRATLQPVAQEILPPDIRTARRGATLLDQGGRDNYPHGNMPAVRRAFKSSFWPKLKLLINKQNWWIDRICKS